MLDAGRRNAKLPRDVALEHRAPSPDAVPENENPQQSGPVLVAPATRAREPTEEGEPPLLVEEENWILLEQRPARHRDAETLRPSRRFLFPSRSGAPRWE
jgi:hypothetical protein